MGRRCGTSGYVPRVVRQSAELLRDAAGRYVFISSISAYADHSAPYDESAALATLDDPLTEDIGAAYGGLKAACEGVVDEVFGERGTSVRAGLIVGPHDPTDRFTYWPVRISEGGDVLVPGEPGRAVQFIDARDLGAWTVELAAHGPGGPLNATGPAERLELGAFLDRAATALGAECRFSWADDATVLATGVEPWTELPLWAPGAELEGLMEARIDRALAAGLELRPARADRARHARVGARGGPAAADALTRARARDPRSAASLSNTSEVLRSERKRKALAAAVVLNVAGTIVARRLGYEIPGNVVVRCRRGHLFTTIWIPGVSVKSIRLGWWRIQRCPVGPHWSIVVPVREMDLSRRESRRAHELRDIRVP